MDEDSIEFLAKLSDSHGPAGFEKETTDLLKEYVSQYADSVYADKIGSLLFEKKGTADSPTVLIPGHMDEIGFIITSIDDKGFLTFHTLGGWFDQILLGQRVVILTNKGKVRGTIASKPPHVLGKEERDKVITKDKMFIDIGCSNADEVRALGIRVGDAAVPDSTFFTTVKTTYKDGEPTGERTLAFGKGFDDRVGVFMAAMLIKTLREQDIEHPNTVVGAGTVQEEVGLRGARTVANLVDPDVALILEVDIAGDMPEMKDRQAPTKMGEGVGILTYDASMIPNQPLKELVIETCERHEIPHQLSQVTGGGTDAGAIHVSNVGCPSIVLTVPTRHIHSQVGIVDLADVESALSLVIEMVKVLDEDRVKSLIEV